MDLEKLNDYENDWIEFRKYIEGLAKDRCVITNKNWKKIREIHMHRYLQEIDNPCFFLFQVKFFHPDKYRKIHCIPKFYGMYREQRQTLFHNEMELD